VVNAVAHIHIKPPRLTKQGFVTGGAAAVAVAGGLLLGIRLRFHNHAPQHRSLGLAFNQQAADELGCNLLGGGVKKDGGRCWEGLGGYGAGLEVTADISYKQIYILKWESNHLYTPQVSRSYPSFHWH